MKTQTSETRKRASYQIKSFLKKRNDVTVHISQMEDDLIYVDFKANSIISEKEMRNIEKQFNERLNPYKIQVDVRKIWF